MQSHNENTYNMKRLIILLLATLVATAGKSSRHVWQEVTLPVAIESGAQGKNHVQGIAYDRRRGCIYMSFTTSLIKLDMQGHLLARVTGLTGHLGCLALDEEGDRLYASLEYKHDVIGAGIAKGLGVENDSEDGFYIASFNLAAITEPEMDASSVMKTVYVREAVQDYSAKVTNGGKEWEHRFACSGIDGIAVAPYPGGSSRRGLYVAYGVYGDRDRTDNDYQVLLCYDIDRLRRYEQTLSATRLHKSGPSKPSHKFFVYTGSTNFGIQNLTYDPSLGCLLAAVYPGKKEGWANFRLFAINLKERPRKSLLKGVEPATKADVLPLLHQGKHDDRHDVWGWHFGYGSTGLCALGDGLYYVSHNSRDAKTGAESCRAVLYRWVGTADTPFVGVGE